MRDLGENRCRDRETGPCLSSPEGRRVHEEVPGPAACERVQGNRLDGLVERIRQGVRPAHRPIRDLDLRSLSDQDIDDGLRGSTGSDDQDPTIPHAQTERTEGESEPEDVRVVTLGPAVSDDDRVHGAETLRVPVEFVELLDDRLLVRARDVESADMVTLGGLEQGIERLCVAVERQVDSWDIERAQRGFVDRGRQGMAEGMADQAQDHRLPTAEARTGCEGELTGRDRASPERVLELLTDVFRKGPRNHPADSSPDEDDTPLPLRLSAREVDELDRGIEVLGGSGHLGDIADRRASLQRLLDSTRLRDRGEMVRSHDRRSMPLRQPPEGLDTLPVSLLFDVDVRETLSDDFVQQRRTPLLSQAAVASLGLRLKRGDRLRADRRREIPDRHGIEVPNEIEPQFREVGPFRKSGAGFAFDPTGVVEQDDRRDLRHGIAPKSCPQSAFRDDGGLRPSEEGLRRPPSSRLAVGRILRNRLSLPWAAISPEA